MTAWPRSAYVLMIGLFVAGVAAVCWVHVQTRNAYHAVGLNDGKNQQRAQTMMDIQKNFPVQHCNDLRVIKPPVEFLAVKAESIHVATLEDDSVVFCR